MEPQETTSQALTLAVQGDLEQAAELLNELCEEYREFGPGYVAHALVFLLGGDTAQAVTDLDAADWANQEYGTPEQRNQARELRGVVHAVRTLYGGQKESDQCRAIFEELKDKIAPSASWFLPAACLEFAWRPDDAKKWTVAVAKQKQLQPAADQYWQKSSGWTTFLMKNPALNELAPVHYARHMRAKREGDNTGAAKHLKRLQEVVKPLEPWGVIARYAAGEATVETV